MAGRGRFLPAAGNRNDTNLNNVGSNGNYWSSSLNTDYPYIAWYVIVESRSVYSYDYYRRLRGFSVRPVTE